MPLQDLTPQLRTRLNKMERAVGWFVFLATALLLFGFGYYIYHTAERKGWFKIKAPFFTFVQSSSGLNVGDDVVMMGFAVGKITSVEPQKPFEPHNVKVQFEITEPYFRYLWTGGTYVKVNAADFLGKRQLEVTRATNGYALVVTQPVSVFTNLEDLKQKVITQPGEWQLSQDVFDENTNLIFHAYDTLTESNLQVIVALKPEALYAYDNKEKSYDHIVASWHKRNHRYENFTPNSDDAYLHAMETAPIGDQLQGMVTQVQNALPGFLSLTNKLNLILDNAANATSNLNTTLAATQPLVTNLTFISGELRDPGSPLIWALGAEGNGQVQGVLTNLNGLLVNTDTNLGALLFNLADLTGGLNAQVQSNSNMLGGIAKTVGDTDDLVQGLKRHWLLRSAFKTPVTNQPPTKTKK
ncbi:MAG TPA: MlaD family protein [Candidatus Acidoferrales bacterium]|nr:MlaD family protein [Candidatus Acidoferrales bacterium]